MRDYNTARQTTTDKTAGSGSVSSLPPPGVTGEWTKLSRLVERTVDGEHEFSVREMLTRIYIRKWTLILCTVVPALLALSIALLTPMTWQASTKILIRYSSSESVFLKGLIPDDRVSLSGATSSEIIRSLPTLEEVIRRHDIQESDLYQTTTKVISGYLADWFRQISGDEMQRSADEKLNNIARRFQDSLRASSSLSSPSSKVTPIEVLSSTSPVPQSVRGDELITLTVKAFSRAKVAELTNGLAQAFIDQYYRISAEDAHRSFEFLSLLADRFEADVRHFEQRPGAAAPSSLGVGPGSSGNGRIARDSPLMATLANELATLEARLGRTKQIYKEESPEVQRQKAEVDSVRALITSQSQLELAKQTLEQIKERRFQALNTERLYTSHLVPISIIEPAVTPPSSSSAWVLRLLISGLTGLLIGVVFGLAVVVVMGLLDQRLFTTWDIERSLALPVLGWVPQLAKPSRGKNRSRAAVDPLMLAAEDGFSQLIVRLNLTGARSDPNVVAMASTNDNDGKSFAALLLAKAVACDNDCKVLLIDADPMRASLTRGFCDRGRQEAVDLVPTERTLPKVILPSDNRNIDLIPQAHGAGQSVAQYSRWLRSCLEEARGRYDLIIVDTPSMGLSGRALVCCEQADRVLVLVRCGVSRKGPLRDLLRSLQEAAVVPHGAIMNFRRYVLPGFIYRHV